MLQALRSLFPCKQQLLQEKPSCSEFQRNKDATSSNQILVRRTRGQHKSLYTTETTFNIIITDTYSFSCPQLQLFFTVMPLLLRSKEKTCTLITEEAHVG